MSTASAASTGVRSHPSDRFSTQRSVHGDVTVLTMAGTLNEGFEGKKLADSVRTKRLVVDMKEIRRIASWGMAEWMEFLRVLADRDVYIVECSTYAVSQLNLVTGLLGHSKLVSFYAAYRCNSCSAVSNSLFLIPRDRGIIRELPGSEYQCGACGGAQRLEEYPAAFFEEIASRDTFDIDDEVLALLRARYEYDLTPDVTRFRAVGIAQGDQAYLRLSGELARIPAGKLVEATRPTTLVDLQGVLFERDAAGADAWRAYVDAVLPAAVSLQLAHCPPGFLEGAVTQADLRGKLKIRSFALEYDCLRCGTRTPQSIDVAEHLEQLVQGKAPAAACPTCKDPLAAIISPELAARLRSLPARDRDPVFEKLVAKATAQPTGKLENVLAATKRAVAPARAPRRDALYAVIGLVIVVLGGVAWFAIDTLRERPVQQVVTPTGVDASPPRPTFTRPEWITAEVPSAAYCHDMINRLMCVGVSSYRSDRDIAVAEATDAALEELVQTVALKISEPFFQQNVAARYTDARLKLLAALHAAEADRASPEYLAARDAVQQARRRVVEALRRTGGPAVPAQRSDCYWEEYAGEGSAANEQLVFVRYDVTVDVVRALVERYSTVTVAASTSMITAFPALGWELPTFAGGAMLTVPSRSLARAGAKPQDIVIAVGADPIADAADLGKRLEAAGKSELALTLTSASTPSSVIKVRP